MPAIETYAIQGTAALDIYRGWASAASSDLGIVAVRTGNKPSQARGMHAAEEATLRDRAASALRNMLDSSEMYCSLKFEDFRGCPYGVFTRKGIATLSTVSACVATLSLVLGA